MEILRCPQPSSHVCHFYFIAFVMKFEVAACITMTFCDKNMDMHDIRLMH